MQYPPLYQLKPETASFLFGFWIATCLLVISFWIAWPRTCSIELENDGKSDLILYIEPEGAAFALSPKDKLEIIFKGLKKPVQLNYGEYEKGRPGIALWPDAGDYELVHKGRNKDQLMMDGK